jgi:hypothetical protein
MELYYGATIEDCPKIIRKGIATSRLENGSEGVRLYGSVEEALIAAHLFDVSEQVLGDEDKVTEIYCAFGIDTSSYQVADESGRYFVREQIHMSNVFPRRFESYHFVKELFHSQRFGDCGRIN